MRDHIKIGLVTYMESPQLTASDRLFIPMFAERKITAEPLVWSDPAVQWQDYSLVLVRSAWDSHIDPAGFARWLDHLANLGVNTFNPIPLIRQNQHKFYLRDLERNGVRIIPTLFIDRADQLDLSVLKASGWTKAVIKPAVSANSYLTGLFDGEDYKQIQQKYQHIAQDRELLVQEFMPEIQQFGEISLVFINRTYSHAILKSASQTDFRVQAEYGGQARYFRAGKSLIESARHILDQFEGDILYARIDGVVRDKEFYLMEIELTDPELYFDHCPEARDKFVQATIELMAGSCWLKQ